MPIIKRVARELVAALVVIGSLLGAVSESRAQLPDHMASVVTVVVFDVLLTTEFPKEASSSAINSPLRLEDAMSISGAKGKTLLTFGSTLLKGPITISGPSSDNLANLPCHAHSGFKLSRIITGQVTIPKTSWGPGVDKYGFLVDSGPFILKGLDISGPVVVPGNSAGAVTISGPTISGHLDIRGPVTWVSGEAGQCKQVVIAGPLTIDGPTEFLSMHYGPYSDDKSGPLLNPGPVTVNERIVIEGPIIAQGIMAN